MRSTVSLSLSDHNIGTWRGTHKLYIVGRAQSRTSLTARRSNAPRGASGISPRMIVHNASCKSSAPQKRIALSLRCPVRLVGARARRARKIDIHLSAYRMVSLTY